jgi:hypothetical protein
MESPPKQGPIPRVIALIFVSVGMAWEMKRFDASSLAKINSTPAADIIQHQRELHMHSPLHWFIIMLVFGGFYVGAIDFITYLIGSFLKKTSG